MSSSFFAMMLRMKYINRWALMRNTYQESLSSHSLDVAIIAHALATIGNVRLGKKLDADHIAVLALFHDAAEILTGDMPTPAKYYNKDIRNAYKTLEDAASDKLLSLLPEYMTETYSQIFDPSPEEYTYVRAADKISALIKCIEEIAAGNREFNSAYNSTISIVKALDLAEANIFLEEFIPAFSLTLDEQGNS